MLGKSNDDSTEEKQVTTANEWNDEVKHHNTWLAIKNCNGTCQYFEPTKSQICLVLMKGLVGFSTALPVLTFKYQ